MGSWRIVVNRLRSLPGLPQHLLDVTFLILYGVALILVVGASIHSDSLVLGYGQVFLGTITLAVAPYLPSGGVSRANGDSSWWQKHQGLLAILVLGAVLAILGSWVNAKAGEHAASAIAGVGEYNARRIKQAGERNARDILAQSAAIMEDVIKIRRSVDEASVANNRHYQEMLAALGAARRDESLQVVRSQLQLVSRDLESWAQGTMSLLSDSNRYVTEIQDIVSSQFRAQLEEEQRVSQQSLPCISFVMDFVRDALRHLTNPPVVVSIDDTVLPDNLFDDSGGGGIACVL